jgi:RNA polymerase sigma-70 factor (ECF subfamily)
MTAGVDRDVWLEFFDQYADLILGFARSRGLQESDREDVLQAVLAALVRAMPGFRYDRQRGRFRSLLWTMTRRAIVDHVRQERRSPTVPLDGTDGLAAPSAAEEEAWELEWRQHHLRRALRAVEHEFSEANMQAFHRYVVGGAPPEDVARSLGISVEQVYQAKSRILKRLSAAIEQQRRDED